MNQRELIDQTNPDGSLTPTQKILERGNEDDLRDGRPFVKVNPKEVPAFCVDGRAPGEGDFSRESAFPQVPGGLVVFSAVLEKIINGRSDDDLLTVMEEVAEKLKQEGYQLGVHTSTHAHKGVSDCGFADNLGNILRIFKERFDEIKNQIRELGISDISEEIWTQANNLINKIDVQTLPTGEEIINKGEELGAQKQTLDGTHQERAVLVNLKPGTTLDVVRSQDDPAFNFDLWLVLEIAEKMNWDLNLLKALSLGLYAATEMVLVRKLHKSDDELQLMGLTSRPEALEVKVYQ